MQTVRESSFPVPGFKFSGIKCGIKYQDKYDMGLIVSDNACIHTAVYTQNKVVAAPVMVDRSRKHTPIQAILVNSNNANACTGTAGHSDTLTLLNEIERLLSIKANSALMCSTGVIGVPLPVEKMHAVLPELVKNVSATGHDQLAQSMMTTDTRPKQICYEFDTSRGTKKIGAFVKGSGMIAPNMATLLAFLVTDATIDQNDLDVIFKRHISRSFNAITIDGDMSTNDTAILLSYSGAGGDNLTGSDLAAFESALKTILERCAVMLVRDGEGTTHCVKIEVKNAKTEQDAKLCARSIAESLLVKTAFFGKDPNWGRIACAAGYSGCELEQSRLDVSIGSIKLLEKGEPAPFDKATVIAEMDKDEYTVSVDLNIGTASWSYWTSDLSYDYVKINAEYTT